MTNPPAPVRSFSSSTSRVPESTQGSAVGKSGSAAASPIRSTFPTEISVPQQSVGSEQAPTRPAPALPSLSVPPAVAALESVPVTKAAPSATTSEAAVPPQAQAPSTAQKVAADAGEIGSPATAAFRDLSTGAVVETDKEGNTAMPSTHPSIRSPILPSPGGPTNSTAPDDEMSGLNAAAEFLSSDRLSVRRPEGAGSRPPSVLNGGPDEERFGDGWHEMGPQVTGFAIASSKRNDDFHALFPTVPEDDFLIESYGCAISRELLIQGRMYVSEARVCFYSSIFGWVTSIVVPFADIVSIEKRNTAYVIPNAILIKTLQSKYHFSSLVTRDNTYSMLVNIWRLSQPSAGAQQTAMTAEVAQETQSEDEKGGEKGVGGKCLSKRERLRRRLALARSQAKKQLNNSGDAPAANAGSGAASPHDADDDMTESSSESEDEAEEQDASSHRVTHCDCDAKKLHLANTVLDDTFDVQPKKLFHMLFCEEFMENFLTENQHLTELKISNWENDGTNKDVSASRKVQYIKPLNGPIGPKQTHCEIKEEQLHIDFDDFCTTMTTTQTPDVPSGSSFYIKTRTCFMWAEHGHTRLLVTCAVEWTGRSMIKSIIDKASIEGQKQYYTDLADAIRQHLSGQSSSSEQGTAAQGADNDKQTNKSAVAGVTEAPVSPTSPTAASAQKEGKQSGSTPAAPQPSPDAATSLWDKAQQFVQSLAESLGVQTSTLLLSGLIALLLLSHLVVFFRGTPSAARTHTFPYHLGRPGLVARNQPMALRHATLMIDEEVQQTLEVLEKSRHLSEALEVEIKMLRDTIHEQTQQYRARLGAGQT
ncbi:hypothetical protein MBRA1_001531 [Malassezia brasiliensis]|uniref:VASt domain-containing protein n=1 Tax=Malassezia brasiliensis TaxID=1821822 RepID=A0AAF0ISF7_9BASI|nr:hypothetical protein MBRA1_001531 [Malassezia brasiliensis]